MRREARFLAILSCVIISCKLQDKLLSRTLWATVRSSTLVTYPTLKTFELRLQTWLTRLLVTSLVRCVYLRNAHYILAHLCLMHCVHLLDSRVTYSHTRDFTRELRSPKERSLYILAHLCLMCCVHLLDNRVTYSHTRDSYLNSSIHIYECPKRVPHL